jgi:hypothetical protein
MKAIANQYMQVQPDLRVAQCDLVKVTNEVGALMYKYVYWIIKTPDTTYKISDPAEHHRIVKAMNTPNTRFVRINDDLVNILHISSIIKKSGFYSIEEKP